MNDVGVEKNNWHAALEKPEAKQVRRREVQALVMKQH